MAIITLADAGGNYNATTTWVGGVVPTSADDVVFTATSGNLIVNVASVAKTFICTNYVGTLTMSATLTVTGNVTLVAAMTITGTSDLILNATATLTSNGKTFSGGIQAALSGITLTLADNWAITGSLTISNLTYLTGAFSLSVGANLTLNNVLAPSGSVSTVILNGTGTWSNAATHYIGTNLTINTVGTVTVSGSVTYNQNTLKYIAGTVVTTGSTLSNSIATTYDTAGITWNNVSIGGGTSTLTTALTLTGNFTTGSDSSVAINGASITVGGNLTNVRTLSGSSPIILNGTGTWTSGTLDFSKNVTINTTGTITISGTITYNTGTLTYIAGTVVTTGSTLKINFTTTLNTSGMTWNNVTFDSANTTTLLSSLSCVNLTFNSIATLSGAYNINVSGNLTMTTAHSVSGGRPTIILTGTGTWSGAGGSSVTANLTINSAGTITISGNVFFNSGTLIYTAGTMVVTNSTLNFNGGATVNTSGMTWNNVAEAGATTITNNSVLNVSGTFSHTSGGTTWNGFNINMSSFYIANGNIATGTSTFVFNGTGTWSSVGGVMQSNTTINTAGTLTISGTITYNNGTLTYTTGTVVTTGSTLSLTSACALNTNGSTSSAATTTSSTGINWNNVTISGTTSVLTVTSPLCVIGTLGYSQNINGSSTYLLGDFSIGTSYASGSATSVINFIGTSAQTWSGSGRMSNSIIINKSSGALTISGTVNLFGCTSVTHTLGTVVTTGSTIYIESGAPNFNTSGINFNIVTPTGGITLSSDLNCVDFNPAGAINGTGYTALVSRHLANGYIYGTATIKMIGTGNWTTYSLGLAMSLVIDTVGVITMGSTIGVRGGSLTVLNSSTLITTGNTLDMGDSGSTISAPNVTFNNVNLNTGTHTLNALLTVGGTLRIGTQGTITFAGTHGFTCNTFTCTTAGRIINYAVNKTYTVTNSIIVTGTSASKIIFYCATAHAFFNLQVGATQDVQNCNATNINSAGGQTIHSSVGTLINTINWMIASGNFFLMF